MINYDSSMKMYNKLIDLISLIEIAFNNDHITLRLIDKGKKRIN